MIVKSYAGFGVAYPVLRVGSTDDAVNDLQQALINNGYAIGASGPDGIFGPATLAAVQNFQSEHGLPRTGVVDAATWYALIPDNADAPGSASSPSGLSTGKKLAIAGGASLLLLAGAVAFTR